MKTAEEWLKQADESKAQFTENYEEWRISFAREIQLDAMRGMRMAATIVATHGWRNEPQVKHILSDVEQLTEKDL